MTESPPDLSRLEFKVVITKAFDHDVLDRPPTENVQAILRSMDGLRKTAKKLLADRKEDENASRT